MEKKSATLPYLPIENVKCVSMYESGNFVRIIKNRCCKSSYKIEKIVNQSLCCISSFIDILSRVLKLYRNKDTFHKRPAKFII